ncbi:hypothetical protein [Bradyrhizobium sp. JR3.5]
MVGALKPFGSRGNVLLGNGSATKPNIAGELSGAGLTVKHRDLSNAGGSSPSVHNKFVVESDAHGNAIRVLTGSTNWTTTGLCTQLNNVLIIENAVIAKRYLDQWGKLVAAGNAMPPALKASNSSPTSDSNISVFFAATNGEAEFKPALDLIKNAKDGALFLMFMPGQSPLLDALLVRAQQNDIYVRGVVSTMMASKSGDIVSVGDKEQELDFWMEEPVPPRPAGSGGGGGAAQQPSAASGASARTVVKKTPKKATKKSAKKAAKTSAKTSAKKAKASKPAKAKKTKAKTTKKAKAKKGEGQEVRAVRNRLVRAVGLEPT